MWCDGYGLYCVFPNVALIVLVGASFLGATLGAAGVYVLVRRR